MSVKKEEFTSIGGSTISLGRFKHREYDYSGEKQLINHSNATILTPQVKFGGGLHDTKFGKGFARRQQTQIQNPLADSELQKIESYQSLKTLRSEQTASIRAKMIEERSHPGFDIISGAPKSTMMASSSSSGGLKCFKEVLGPEAPRRGQAVLRESQGRYFAPFPTGKNLEYRQDVLYNEGLLNKRYCGILEPHKKDLPSFGIEDQFSKSEYMKTSDATRTGLYEARIPGKYTPRKLPNHPSGNEKIVEKWNTDIDLNNRTLRGIL
eukprot:gene32777-39627_t